MKLFLCCALALLMFHSTAQAQYLHPGEDAPQIAMLMNLAPRSSWIVFFCPDPDFCEAHVVCYYHGNPVALDPLTIDAKRAAKMNLYDAQRAAGLSDKSARRRTNCQVRSEQDLDVRAYTRIGDAIVSAHEKTVTFNLRGAHGPPVPHDGGPVPLNDGYYAVWTNVVSDPRGECGGRGDNDVGMVHLEGGSLTGAKKRKLKVFGTVSADGLMEGYYVDGYTSEGIGTFEGAVNGTTSASGTWDSYAWGCIGTWTLGP